MRSLDVHFEIFIAHRAQHIAAAMCDEIATRVPFTIKEQRCLVDSIRDPVVRDLVSEHQRISPRRLHRTRSLLREFQWPI